ncbi:MAG: glycosyltransferase family 87 protein [Armatimonadota bacterium]
MEGVGKSAFNFKIDKRAFALGFAIFALGLLIRLIGIGWGLPNSERVTSLHPDEPIVLGVAQRIQPTQLNFTPGFYNYGTFYPSLLRVAIDGINAYGGGPVGEKPTPESIAVATAHYHMAGRVISALAGAAIGWVVVLLLLPFAGQLGAGAGGLACAIAPGLVVHSRFQTVDVLATFLAACSLLWAIRVATVEAPSLKWVGFAGMLAGLSAGTKYTGLLLLLPLCTGIYFGFKSDKIRLGKALGIAVGSILIAFVVSTPGVLLQTDAFMRDFKYEALHTSQGHGLTFIGTSSGFIYHLSNLAETLSPLLLLMGAIGLAWLAYQKQKWVVVMVVFGLAYYVLIGRAEVKFLRYVLPLVPVIACGFGGLVGWLHQQAGYVKYINVFGIVALTGFGGGGLYQTIVFSQWMQGDDLRDVVGRDLRQKAPASVGIVEDAWFWTPTLYPMAAVPRAVPFLARLEAQQAAPVKVLQVVDGEARPQWDTRLIEQLKPDRITFTSFEYDDLERMAHMTKVPDQDKPLVDAFILFLKTLNRDYEPELPEGMSQPLGMEGPKVHDLMYIRPTIWVWKRKTASPTP